MLPHTFYATLSRWLSWIFTPATESYFIIKDLMLHGFRHRETVSCYHCIIEDYFRPRENMTVMYVHPSEIQRLLEKKMYMVFLAKYQLFNISIAKIYWFKNISTGEKVQKHFFSSINICLRWNFAKKPPCKISPINAEFLRGGLV